MGGGARYRGRVGGLPVPLRLVLSAQKGGAAAIHFDPSLAPLLPELADERVKVRLTTEPPPDDLVTIELPVDVVVHGATWAALVSGVADGRGRYLGGAGARVEARPPKSARVSHGPSTPLVFAPPFGFPPIRVATRADAVRTTTALLRACRKPQDGWTSTYLNRYISLSITRLVLHTPLRPNHMTLAIALLGVFGGVLASRGTREGLIFGAALLQWQSMLDGCDGELSRMTFRSSRLGEWLDTIGDDISNYTFFGGACLGMHRATGHWAYLLIGAAIVGCGGLASAIEYRYLIRVGSGDLLVYPILEGGKWGDSWQGRQPLAGRIATALQPLFKRDTFVLLTFLSAVLGILGPMLLASAIGAVGILITVLRTEARLARERREAEAAAAK